MLALGHIGPMLRLFRKGCEVTGELYKYIVAS